MENDGCFGIIIWLVIIYVLIRFVFEVMLPAIFSGLDLLFRNYKLSIFLAIIFFILFLLNIKKIEDVVKPKKDSANKLLEKDLQDVDLMDDNLREELSEMTDEQIKQRLTLNSRKSEIGMKKKEETNVQVVEIAEAQKQGTVSEVIYVADSDNYRIQKFTPQGEFITKWGNKGSGEGEFNLPNCIAIDSQDQIIASRNSPPKVNSSRNGEIKAAVRENLLVRSG